MASVTFRVYTWLAKALNKVWPFPPGVQVYVYGGVPPEAVPVMVPELELKQSAGVEEAIFPTKAGGSVKEMESVVVQPAASVTVTTWVPALRPAGLNTLRPEGDQEYVYGAVPPIATMLAVPLFWPKQDTLAPVTVVLKA
jgi:hypothetical protein